jgi:hypothetical protein
MSRLDLGEHAIDIANGIFTSRARRTASSFFTILRVGSLRPPPSLEQASIFS